MSAKQTQVVKIFIKVYEKIREIEPEVYKDGALISNFNDFLQVCTELGLEEESNELLKIGSGLKNVGIAQLNRYIKGKNEETPLTQITKKESLNKESSDKESSGLPLVGSVAEDDVQEDNQETFQEEAFQEEEELNENIQEEEIKEEQKEEIKEKPKVEKPKRQSSKKQTQNEKTSKKQTKKSTKNEIPKDEKVKEKVKVEKNFKTQSFQTVHIHRESSNPVFQEPGFDIPSLEDEKKIVKKVLEMFVSVFDYSQGKHNTKGEATPKETDIEVTLENGLQLVKELLDLYNFHYVKIREFYNKYVEDDNFGNIKITKKEVKITFKAPKVKAHETKVPKKDDVMYGYNEEWNKYQTIQTQLNNFISKNYISAKYLDILSSGIISSRNIMHTSDLAHLASTTDTVGLINSLNINLCEKYICEENTDKSFQENVLEYINLIARSNLSSQTPSKIFASRYAIINHPSYKMIDIPSLWNAARDNLEKVTDNDVYVKIWKEILDSKFMYDIIMKGFRINPNIESSFNKFINDKQSIELFKGPLMSISFMFTSLCLGPICPNKSLSETLRIDHCLYNYETFNWVYLLRNDDGRAKIDN